jgi:hypothetical protein
MVQVDHLMLQSKGRYLQSHMLRLEHLRQLDTLRWLPLALYPVLLALIVSLSRVAADSPSTALEVTSIPLSPAARIALTSLSLFAFPVTNTDI